MPAGTQDANHRGTILDHDRRLRDRVVLRAPGITTSVEVVDFVESCDKEMILKKLPGKREPADDRVEAGQEHRAWSCGRGTKPLALGDMVAARKSCSLVMFDADGKPVARYHLENAWPCKIELGALKAGASEVLMETVTIVCEHIQRVAP